MVSLAQLGKVYQLSIWFHLEIGRFSGMTSDKVQHGRVISGVKDIAASRSSFSSKWDEDSNGVVLIGVCPSEARAPLEGYAMEQERLLGAYCNVTNDEDVCAICGSAGYEEMLAICSECNAVAEHIYCMLTLLDTVPKNWICESCKRKERASYGSGRHAIESTSPNSFDRMSSTEKSKLWPLSPSKQGDVIFERVVTCARSQPVLGKSLAGNGICLPISKQSIAQSICEVSQSATLPAKPLLSHENSLRATESGKLKCSSPTTLNSLAIGSQYPGGSKMVEKSPKKVSGEPMPVLSRARSTSFNSLEKETSHQDYISSISPPCQTQMLNMVAFPSSKCSTSKFTEDMPSFLLPSRPEGLSRSNREASGKNLKVKYFDKSKTRPEFPKSSCSPSIPIDYGTGSSMAQHTLHSLDSIVTVTSCAHILENAKTANINGSAAIGISNVVLNQCKEFQNVQRELNCFQGTGDYQEAQERASGRTMKNASLRMTQGPEFMAAVSPMRCYLCNGIEHSTQACTKEMRRSAMPKVMIGFKEPMFHNGSSISELQEFQESSTSSALKELPYGEMTGTKGQALEQNEACFAYQLEKNCSNLVRVSSLPCKQELSMKSSPNLCTDGSINSNLFVSSEGSGIKVNESAKLSTLNESIRQQLDLSQNTGNSQQECLQTSSVKPLYEASPIPAFQSSFCDPLLTGYHVPCFPEAFTSSFSAFENGLTPWGKQLYPGMISTHENMHGPVIAVRPVVNANMSHLSQFRNLEPALPVLPEPACVWRGCIQASSNGVSIGFCSGVQAHPSNRADPKVHKTTKALPSSLWVEELQRVVGSNAWPRSFQQKPPDVNSIGVFFFPMEGHKESYRRMCDRMINHDLTWRVCLESVELLIFPSTLLPAADQCWNGATYLWGVFRASKAIATQTNSCFTCYSVDNALLPSSVIGQDHVEVVRPGFENGVCEVVDMDIDMEASERSLIEKVVVPASEVLHFSPPHLPVPPLPPDSPPVLPLPPPSSCNSEQDVSLTGSESLVISSFNPNRFSRSESLSGNAIEDNNDSPPDCPKILNQSVNHGINCYAAANDHSLGAKQEELGLPSGSGCKDNDLDLPSSSSFHDYCTAEGTDLVKVDCMRVEVADSVTCLEVDKTKSFSGPGTSTAWLHNARHIIPCSRGRQRSSNYSYSGSRFSLHSRQCVDTERSQHFRYSKKGGVWNKKYENCRGSASRRMRKVSVREYSHADRNHREGYERYTEGRGRARERAKHRHLSWHGDRYRLNGLNMEAMQNHRYSCSQSYLSDSDFSYWKRLHSNSLSRGEYSRCFLSCREVHASSKTYSRCNSMPSSDCMRPQHAMRFSSTTKLPNMATAFSEDQVVLAEQEATCTGRYSCQKASSSNKTDNYCLVQSKKAVPQKSELTVGEAPLISLGVSSDGKGCNNNKFIQNIATCGSSDMEVAVGTLDFTERESISKTISENAAMTLQCLNVTSDPKQFLVFPASDSHIVDAVADSDTELGGTSYQQRHLLKLRPLIQQMEKQPLNHLKSEHEAGQSSNQCISLFELEKDSAVDVGTGLTLKVPHYRKFGSSWIKLDGKGLSTGANADMPLSLALGHM